MLSSAAVHPMQAVQQNLSRGFKSLEREADHLLPSSAEI
jgi:hypothetical protein